MSDVFLSKGEGIDATENVLAEEKTEIFITFARGQNGNSIHRPIER